VLGALLAIPVAAAIQITIREYLLLRRQTGTPPAPVADAPT
jgi:predicted PurR-regulated permease PerM